VLHLSNGVPALHMQRHDSVEVERLGSAAAMALEYCGGKDSVVERGGSTTAGWLVASVTLQMDTR
jgi:hypothetical protein